MEDRNGAPNVRIINQTVRITAAMLAVAFIRWIISVHGITTPQENSEYR